MIEIYKLVNQIKHYEWGSPKLLPDFLGLTKPDSLPWAEMWMGTHSSAPSFAVHAASLEISGSEKSASTPPAVPLSDLLVNDGLSSDGELPFLFKVLAVEKPLSLQAHPNREQAAEGLRRENEKGLASDDPLRNYKDGNPKPEILCAITPFTVMAGFNSPQDIYDSLEALMYYTDTDEECEIIDNLLSALLHNVLRFLNIGEFDKTVVRELAIAKIQASEAATNKSLKNFFQALFALPKQEIEIISAFINNAKDIVPNDISSQQWELLRFFARQYPGDPAFLAPLFLNLFTLQPYQAIFIPAGVLHSYIEGFGVELMSNSDNVLRGGLTPKHVDIGELINILEFKPYLPPVSSASAEDNRQIFKYPPHGGLSLSLLCGEGQEIKNFYHEPHELVPSERTRTEDFYICLVVSGELMCNGQKFKKGESFFVAQKGEAEVSFSGNFTLFIACADGECADEESADGAAQ